jgi:hypothetical protein
MRYTSLNDEYIEFKGFREIMNSTMSIFKKILVGGLVLGLLAASNSYAAGKTYTEDEFLDNFSGKTKKVINERLGNPMKKELSVKPTNASQMTGKNLDDKSSKPVKVEMWYYKNLVKYDKKRTYKETEITFVNDRVMNIAFFNNR